jgi:thiol-disulfide isomerase/thioredoxin
MRRIVPTTTALGLTLTASLTLVVLLSIRLIELRRALGEARRQAILPYRGYVVPTVHAVTLAGDSITIGALADTNGKQLVFVLTTTCPFCRATLPTWQTLVDSAGELEGGRIRIVAMSLDSLAPTTRYVTEHRIGYAVTTLVDWKLIQQFRARAVPQTLVLNHWGQVLFAHTGRLEAGPVLDSLYGALRGPTRIAARPTAAGEAPAGKTSR